MEKDLIHKVITQPELLAQSGSEAFEQLTARYPYFTAAHLLLLKSWQKEGDYRFTDQLHQAAVHTIDRQSLYEYVSRDSKSEEKEVSEVAIEKIVEEKIEPIEIAPSIEDHKTTEETAELVSRILEEESNEPVIKPEEARFSPVIPKTTETQDLVPINSEEEVDQNVAIIEEQEEETEPEQDKKIIHASDIDPFERTLLVEAVRSSIEAEVSEIDEESLTKSVDEATSVQTEAVDGDSFAAYILRRSRQLHFGEEGKLKPDENLTPAAAKDWLREESEEENSEIEENSTASSTIQTNLSHGSRKIHPINPKQHQKDLIDRFIRHEPQIARGKATDYAPGNIAKESLEEDFTMVTETMAKLFVNQGKLDKARKAYRKLMELFPEKSIYFAAQLKNLDKNKK